MNNTISLIIYFTIARIGIQILNLQSIVYLEKIGTKPLADFGLAHFFSLALFLVCLSSITPIIQRIAIFKTKGSEVSYANCVIGSILSGLLFFIIAISLFYMVDWLLFQILDIEIFENNNSETLFSILNIGTPFLICFTIIMFLLESLGLWKPVLFAILLTLVIHQILLLLLNPSDSTAIALINIGVKIFLFLSLLIYTRISRTLLFGKYYFNFSGISKEFRFMLFAGVSLFIGGIGISFAYAILAKLASLSSEDMLASWTILQAIVATTHMAFLGISRMASIQLSLLFAENRLEPLFYTYKKYLASTTLAAILISLSVFGAHYLIGNQTIADKLGISLLLLCSLIIADGIAHLTFESTKSIQQYAHSTLQLLGPMYVLIIILSYLLPIDVEIMAVGLLLALLIQISISILYFCRKYFSLQKEI